MILDDFLAINANGIYCKYADFYLDPQQPVQTAIISHAHADHAVSGNKEVYFTKHTQTFMVLRYARYAAQTFHVTEHNKSLPLKGVKVTIILAGHMLGSAMILMEYQG